MTKFLAWFSALAFVAGLAIAPQPSSAAPMGMDHRRCPRGSHWVAPHRDRMGHWVRGHCSRR
jgi:hypothetical protein